MRHLLLSPRKGYSTRLRRCSDSLLDGDWVRHVHLWNDRGLSQRRWCGGPGLRTMGKNRHSKDKLYIVASEYTRDWGGAKKRELQLPFRCLPFYCCGLSLLPFETPVCTKDGIVFDAKNILAYVNQYHRNPVTGAALSPKDLIPLRFHKNSDGQYHCPVTYKEFNNYSHIVANAKSGHVYSYDAIDALCRRPKNWVDLITNEPFTTADLITIQNPRDVEFRKIEAFDYVKSGRAVPLPSKDTPVQGIAADEGSFDPQMKKSELTLDILQQSTRTEEESKQKHNALIPNVHSTEKNDLETKNAEDEAGRSSALGSRPKEKNELFTTHRQAASFTSTVVNVSYDAEFRDKTDREYREEAYKAVKKSKEHGYVRLVTSLGVLNFELYCSKAPQTCDNFLRHCESGYYKNTIFHRSIPHFMIQGGDPLGTGCGGESAFEGGGPFEDEFHPHLVHKGPGILSMANNGRNSNKSQFFITYNSCEHLNNAHSVFGKLVGGSDTLAAMQELPTDEEDRPRNPPKILDTIVFKNPFKEYFEKKAKQQEEVTVFDVSTHGRQEQAKSAASQTAKLTAAELVDPMRNHVKRHAAEVGKYADPRALKELKRQAVESNSNKLLTRQSKGFSFDAW